MFVVVAAYVPSSVFPIFLCNLNFASGICIIFCYKFIKVLVVQERHCSLATLGLWKIPTGFILQVFNFAASLNFIKCFRNKIEDQIRDGVEL